VFSRHLIESAEWTAAGLELSVRLNWYRALPLSCIERFDIDVDGRRVDPDLVTVQLAGARWTCAQLTDAGSVDAEADDTWWHIGHSCRATAALEPRPGEGGSVVDLVMGTRIPYLVGPGGDAVVIVDRARAVVTR
jgi:hypothetical protein